MFLLFDTYLVSLHYMCMLFIFVCTLTSGIDVGQGINIEPGKFGKKNKHRALNTQILSSK